MTFFLVYTQTIHTLRYPFKNNFKNPSLKYLIFSKINSEVCTTDLTFALCKLVEFKQKLMGFEKDVHIYICVCKYIKKCILPQDLVINN